MADNQISEIKKVPTVPFDARFPNQNQTRNCWQNYVDFHRCHKIKGDDYEMCDYFKFIYQSLCPNTWDACACKKNKLKTVPFDARFPNQNQTRNCWQNYVDFHRCHKLKGKDYEPCHYFKWAYKELCPSAWTDEWDSQLWQKTFAGLHQIRKK